MENALLAGNPDSDQVELKLCDFGYSKDELVQNHPLSSPVSNVLRRPHIDLRSLLCASEWS